MVVNDYAHELDKRSALESIAGKPAPAVPRDCVKYRSCIGSREYFAFLLFYSLHHVTNEVPVPTFFTLT
jgi:hypothetical protein